MGAIDWLLHSGPFEGKYAFTRLSIVGIAVLVAATWHPCQAGEVEFEAVIPHSCSSSHKQIRREMTYGPFPDGDITLSGWSSSRALDWGEGADCFYEHHRTAWRADPYRWVRTERIQGESTQYGESAAWLFGHRGGTVSVCLTVGIEGKIFPEGSEDIGDVWGYTRLKGDFFVLFSRLWPEPCGDFTFEVLPDNAAELGTLQSNSWSGAGVGGIPVHDELQLSCSGYLPPGEYLLKYSDISVSASIDRPGCDWAGGEVHYGSCSADFYGVGTASFELDGVSGGVTYDPSDETENAPPVATFECTLGHVTEDAIANVQIGWHRVEDGWEATYVPAGAMYTLDATGSYDPEMQDAAENGIVSYAWSITDADGNAVDASIVSLGESSGAVLFRHAGLYDITLTVSDHAGLQSTTSKTMSVEFPQVCVFGGRFSDNMQWGTASVNGAIVPILTSGAAGWPDIHILYRHEDKFVIWDGFLEHLTTPTSQGKTYFYVTRNESIGAVAEVSAEDALTHPDWPDNAIIVGGYERFDASTMTYVSASGFAIAVQAVMDALYAAQSLSEIEGVVEQGETVGHTIPVDANATDLRAALSWPGSLLVLTLTAPDGSTRTSTPSQLLSESTGATHHAVVIENPLPGMWQLDVDGIEVTTGGEDYGLAVAASTPLRLEAETEAGNTDGGSPVIIRAELSDQAGVVDTVTVSATIVHPDTSKVELPLTLESRAADGSEQGLSFSGEYAGSSERGWHDMTVVAEGTLVDGSDFVRTTRTRFWQGSTGLTVSRIAFAGDRDLDQGWQTADGRILLTNNSDEDRWMVIPFVSGEHRNDFSACSPQEELLYERGWRVPAGETIAWSWYFRPSETGLREATINFVCVDALGRFLPTQTIAVTGVGKTDSAPGVLILPGAGCGALSIYTLLAVCLAMTHLRQRRGFV